MRRRERDGLALKGTGPMPMRKVEILRAACCIAGVDGEVCDQEHPLLVRLAREAGVGAASLSAMIERAREDRSFFEKQFDVFKTDPDETMKILFRVAVADGVLTQAERVVLGHFAQKLGQPEERFEALLAAAERHARPQ